jgi:hypothetical protein
MKPASTDDEKETAETPWPRVLRILSSDEFQQSFAVAQLAVKLCEFKKANSKIPIEKENLSPENCLDEAWKLIESAREHVLRPQTDVEYLVQHDGSKESLASVIGRHHELSRIPFQKLCNAKRNKGDTESIKLPDAETGKTIEVEWKVYRGKGGERAFDNLFSKYWCDIGEKWKRRDQEIGIVWRLGTHGKPRRVNFYSETERAQMQTLARDDDAWKKRGESVLASWKRDGVPPNDFLALAKFRREHDKRAANLKKKPKGKRRRVMAKARA